MARRPTDLVVIAVEQPRARLRVGAIGALFATAVLVAGCSGGLPKIPKIKDLNPFQEKEKILAGRRIPILPAKDRVGGGELATAAQPITLPAPFVNASWTQPGGTPNNAPGHVSLSSQIRRAWSADAGTGSSKVGRLTASPIVYGGRIFTLDAASRVTAFSTSGGAAIWRKSLVPEKERPQEGFGGGLAIDNGRLYVATGFGRIAALDPANGKQLWEKAIGLPLRASPTAAADRVFVTTSEGTFLSLSGADGSELWQFRGIPETTRISSNPSPAVDGDVVAVPYPNGDVVALRIADGTPIWQESLAQQRVSTSFAALSDAARPVMSNGVVYALSHGGRFVAIQKDSGERVWSLDIPGTQAPSVGGSSVFVVSTQGQMLAVEKQTGAVQWTVQLPGAKTWSGPALAGGVLWVVSNKGQLVGVEATTGRVATKQNIGQPVYVAPVVADNRLFVLTDKARLIAYR